MSRPLPARVLLWTVLVSLLAAPPLRAQTAPEMPTDSDTDAERPPAPSATPDEKALARERYQSGVEAYREGRYKDAIDLFLEADSLAPSAALSYNTARAYEHLGDVAGALRWYRDYLRRAPEAEDRQSVEQIITDLAQRLEQKGVQQTTVMSDPPGATVLIDGVPRGVTPWTGELEPGDHEVSLRLRGYADTTTPLALAADAPQDVMLALEPAPEQARPPAPIAVPSRSAAALPVDTPARERTNLTPFWIASLGAGAATLGGALTFELLRGQAEKDARDEPVQTDAAQQLDLMESRKTTARILAGVGGALVLTGGVLLTIDLLHSETQVSAACTPNGCGAAMRGHF